jgi:hypothetical protein
MDQEFAEKRAKRHPKGAANSIHYTLLASPSGFRLDETTDQRQSQLPVKGRTREGGLSDAGAPQSGAGEIRLRKIDPSEVSSGETTPAAVGFHEFGGPEIG